MKKDRKLFGGFENHLEAFHSTQLMLSAFPPSSLPTLVFLAAFQNPGQRFLHHVWARSYLKQIICYIGLSQEDIKGNDQLPKSQHI
jgi:hypothetical protein